MSNFSFSHNVFKSCLLLMRQNEYLWSKGWTLWERNKPIRWFSSRNTAEIIVILWFILITVFHKSSQSRLKIRIHILWSQILIYTGLKGNYGRERHFSPLPHNDDLWCTGENSLLKTLLEKKKMLVTSIFFFSHNVFYTMKDNFNILSNI